MSQAGRIAGGLPLADGTPTAINAPGKPYHLFLGGTITDGRALYLYDVAFEVTYSQLRYVGQKDRRNKDQTVRKLVVSTAPEGEQVTANMRHRIMQHPGEFFEVAALYDPKVVSVKLTLLKEIMQIPVSGGNEVYDVRSELYLDMFSVEETAKVAHAAEIPRQTGEWKVEHLHPETQVLVQELTSGTLLQGKTINLKLANDWDKDDRRNIREWLDEEDGPNLSVMPSILQRSLITQTVPDEEDDVGPVGRQSADD